MIIIGHRGARGLAPENTLASLQKALEYGVDMIEIDIRVTADGVAVLHHNANLVDQAGNSLPIRARSFNELLQHKPDLTTLTDALANLQHRVPMVIEIKPGEPVNPVVGCIKRAINDGWKKDELFVASFHFAALRHIHQQLPNTPLIVNEQWSGVRASLRARRLHTPYIAMNARWLWSGFIYGMQHRGYHLLAYTLNSPITARRWGRAGLAGLYTDYPNRFSGKTDTE